MAKVTYRRFYLSYISGGLRDHYGREVWQQAADMRQLEVKAESLNHGRKQKKK